MSSGLERAIACLEREHAAMGAALDRLRELGGGKRRNRLSPEGREKISVAAKKRWEIFRARRPEKKKVA